MIKAGERKGRSWWAKKRFFSIKNEFRVSAILCSLCFEFFTI